MKNLNIPHLFFMVCCMIIASCHQDDNPLKSKPDPLVGEWIIQYTSSEFNGKSESFDKTQLDAMGVIWELILTQDGRAIQITNLSGKLVTMPGTWNSVDNKLNLTLKSPFGNTSKMVYSFTITENLLSLFWQLPAGTALSAQFLKQ